MKDLILSVITNYILLIVMKIVTQEFELLKWPKHLLCLLSKIKRNNLHLNKNTKCFLTTLCILVSLVSMVILKLLDN